MSKVLKASKALKALKALKTPKASKKKALLISPLTLYILPKLNFPDLPKAPAKARSTASTLPPITLSPTRKTRRAKIIQEVIEPPAMATRGGRMSKRRLFHDKVLVNVLANQKAA